MNNLLLSLLIIGVLVAITAGCNSMKNGDSATVKPISAVELKEKMDASEDFLLLDVRQQDEYDFVNLDGTLIPLGQLQQRLGEIDAYKDKEVVVMCRTGSRSGQAARILAREGFQNVFNLSGGINGWSRDVDPSLPTY
jgi:rhodanese-related sulfurtransferase